jgi:hypothetical protein
VYPYGGGVLTVAGLLSAEVARLFCDILAGVGGSLDLCLFGHLFAGICVV